MDEARTVEYTAVAAEFEQYLATWSTVVAGEPFEKRLSCLVDPTCRLVLFCVSVVSGADRQPKYQMFSTLNDAVDCYNECG